MLESWTPDGTTLLVTDLDQTTGQNIAAVQVDGARVEWLLREDYDESSPVVSPDGRWMAYTSDESGAFEVYVRPYPGVDDHKIRVSTGGGLAPCWGPDSDELLFQTASDQDGEMTMMRATFVTEPTLQVGEGQVLFSGPYRRFEPLLGRTWDVAPDGSRFLMIKNNTDALIAGRDTVIVQHWREELNRLVPVD